MKKIMFNDKYGLTQAVLEGRKTMTRRSIPKKLLESIELYSHGNEEELLHRLLANSSYQIGEVVAIAQAYEDVYAHYIQTAQYKKAKDVPENTAGEGNKMFVKADLMPYHIKITNIRTEHLQDISNDDCLREGIRLWKDANPEYKLNPLGKLYEIVDRWDWYKSPREAFAALIDKVSSKGTWDRNPLVWVYEFELVD